MTSDFDPSGEGIEILAPLRARVVPQWERWWLGCDPGWYPLLAHLAEDLTEIARQWMLSQAKEKFGALRFYAHPGTDDSEVRRRFDARIAEAEHLSTATCERCGQAGRLCRTALGGYKTVCPTCSDLIFDATGRRYLPLAPSE